MHEENGATHSNPAGHTVTKIHGSPAVLRVEKNRDNVPGVELRIGLKVADHLRCRVRIASHVYIAASDHPYPWMHYRPKTRTLRSYQEDHTE